MARALGIDLGSKRIGVASSDTTRTIASPVTVVERRGSHTDDHRAIAEIIAEYEPDVIVVGLPRSLNGGESHAAALVRAEVAEMERAFSVPVVVHDERFTTATAHASMIERRMRAPQRRRVVDKVAAAVLLQSWLDGESYRLREDDAPVSRIPPEATAPTAGQRSHTNDTNDTNHTNDTKHTKRTNDTKRTRRQR